MVGLLYSDLQCHVMSHDCIRGSNLQLDHTHTSIEGLTLSIATIAYHLADQVRLRLQTSFISFDLIDILCNCRVILQKL